MPKNRMTKFFYMKHSVKMLYLLNEKLLKS